MSVFYTRVLIDAYPMVSNSDAPPLEQRRMNTLLMNLNLAGQKALIGGGGDLALRKA